MASSFIGEDANHFPHPPSATFSVEDYSIAPGFSLQFPFAHRRPQNATAVNDVALLKLDRPVPGIAPVAIAGPGGWPWSLPAHGVS